MTKNDGNENLPIIVFLPVIICVVCILVLLDIRQREHNPPSSVLANNRNDDLDLAIDEEYIEEDDNHGEGSSTAVRVKKVGKKRGEKLKRKEQMRQYREYMDQQREIRRAQDEIYEEEFRQRKLEESIRRADEMEKRRKEKEKKAKQEHKEELKRQKEKEKEMKKKQQRFDKYSAKVKKLVKEKKLCNIDELSKLIGLSSEDLVDILKQLCDEDSEFELCLWSGTDTFLFVTKEDYDTFNQDIKGKGKMSIHKGFL